MKIPPYGKPLKDLLSQNIIPNNSVYLYIGSGAWRSAENTVMSRPTRTILLPPEASPLDFAWPVSQCDILIIATSSFSQDFIETFAYLLISYGAEKVTYLSIDLLSTIYKRDF
jgi:hypothetical protein